MCGVIAMEWFDGRQKSTEWRILPQMEKDLSSSSSNNPNSMALWQYH